MEKLNGQFFVAVAVFCLVATFTSAETVASKTCNSQGTECKAIANSTCDGSHCKCDAAFKEGTSLAEGTCVPKGLNDTCTPSTDSDCAGVQHAVCKPTDNVCACIGAFKPNGVACVAKGLNDSCAAGTNSECVGVTNAVCKTTVNVCACEGAYKQNGAACVAKAVGDSCAQPTDCSTGDTNSECSTGEPKKCVCKTDFTAINNVCKKGLGNTCTDGTSCSAVSNAECVGTPKKCACKANFKEDKGQCSTANGLQTLLSAPVAWLLLFLTIVVTRLN